MWGSWGLKTSRFALAALAAAALVAGASAVHKAASDPRADWRERDKWQHPEAVMDALGIKAGSQVADVGCGRGYFTHHFALRVGAEGKVYAEDIDYNVLIKISDFAREEKLTQVEVVQGAEDDPHLPEGALDAILVVDAFHEMKQYDAMLQAMLRALKPGGRLGIIDRIALPGSPREKYQEEHKIPPELIRADTARNGFKLQSEEPGFTAPDDHRKYCFLIFVKP